MKTQAAQESAIERHLKTQRDVAFVVEWLTRFGGSDLRFNQFAETIHYLSGIQKGMRISDNNHEAISLERDRKEESREILD